MARGVGEITVNAKLVEGADLLAEAVEAIWCVEAVNWATYRHRRAVLAKPRRRCKRCHPLSPACSSQRSPRR